ncbi:MAG: tetratricopeptide repeat protein [Halioglobus sp.]
MIQALKTLAIFGFILAGQIALSCAGSNAAAATQEAPDRLGQLLLGEALFQSRQSNYFGAINILQSAEVQELTPARSWETRLLLARTKLAYGMHLEAGLEFHAILGEDVPAPQRNRAWYELARSFFYKGYNEAAAETLSYIRGDLPADIVGDHQLLRASVLMSMQKNREAAQELEHWRGAPELAAYAFYNRGIALARAGDIERARPVLESAVKLPADGKERLALRDKARLSLGYLYARGGDYRGARAQFEAVQAQGPFSSRALLGLGWIDYQQGHGESALASWTKLRGRSPTDPAVLETLLVIPALHRERHATQTATQDYQHAIETYNKELQQLQAAKNFIETGNVVSAMLQNEKKPKSNDSIPAQSASRFLGSLMADRSFSELARGHNELQSMLETIDQGLQKTHPISGSAVDQKPPLPSQTEPKLPYVASNTTPAQATAVPEQKQLQTGSEYRQWIGDEKNVSGTSNREIPLLPEIEQPTHHELTPLPKKVSPRRAKPNSFKLPAVSNYIKQPPSPEITGMPNSEILWLPKSGEFRRPGQEMKEDYAYPDSAPQQQTEPGDTYGYQLTRLLSVTEEETHFDSGAVPVGQALRELAVTLNNTTDKMAALNNTSAHYLENKRRQERIDMLHARTLKLRMRIANALELYESYVAAMALGEFERRQHLLEDLLEQASLELAKTYDNSAEQ